MKTKNGGDSVSPPFFLRIPPLPFRCKSESSQRFRRSPEWDVLFFWSFRRQRFRRSPEWNVLFFRSFRRNGMYFFFGRFAGMVGFIFAVFFLFSRHFAFVSGGGGVGEIIPMKIGIFDSLEWNLRFAGMESSIRWNGISDSLE